MHCVGNFAHLCQMSLPRIKLPIFLVRGFQDLRQDRQARTLFSGWKVEWARFQIRLEVALKNKDGFVVTYLLISSDHPKLYSIVKPVNLLKSINFSYSPMGIIISIFFANRRQIIEEISCSSNYGVSSAMPLYDINYPVSNALCSSA